MTFFWVILGSLLAYLIYDCCMSSPEEEEEDLPLAPDPETFGYPDFAEDVNAQADAYELKRMRVGAAFAEAMALQLEEIRSLPEFEPRREMA